MSTATRRIQGVRLDVGNNRPHLRGVNLLPASSLDPEPGGCALELQARTPLDALGALALGVTHPVADAAGWRLWRFGNGDVLVAHDDGTDLLVTPGLVAEHRLGHVGAAIEAAEDAARSLSSLVGEVARVVLGGGVLLAPRISVGPIRPAVGDRYWGCFHDPGGVELVGGHAVPCVNAWGERDEAIADDRSPFGAAHLFVAVAGRIAAGRALRAYRAQVFMG